MNRPLLWEVAVIVPQAAVGAFELAFEDKAWSISSFETGRAGPWRVAALFDRLPKDEELEPLMALAARAAGIKAPAHDVRPVDDDDWITSALKQQPPIRAGRFFVHGSHHRKRIPEGAKAILVDAGMAFGTGHHETTRGCLLALDHLAKSGIMARRVLDMGCGSGILAIAALRLWPGRAIAVDIDPDAVAETDRNRHRNGVADRLACFRADGFADRRLSRGPRFDLITANILARPLIAMANAMAARLRRGGHVILAGLLEDQEALVFNAYRNRGFRFARRIRLNGWSILVLRR